MVSNGGEKERASTVHLNRGRTPRPVPQHRSSAVAAQQDGQLYGLRLRNCKQGLGMNPWKAVRAVLMATHAYSTRQLVLVVFMFYWFRLQYITFWYSERCCGICSTFDLHRIQYACVYIWICAYIYNHNMILWQQWQMLIVLECRVLLRLRAGRLP